MMETVSSNAYLYFFSRVPPAPTGGNSARFTRLKSSMS
jgi:hypothetical protein